MKRALPVLIAALLLPAAAQAATVHVGGLSEGTKFGYGSDYDSARVYYDAAPGETNRLVVDFDKQFESVTLTDPGATIEAGARCERIDEHSARCFPLTPSDSFISSVEARLGDGDDEVRRAEGDDFGRLVALGGPGDDLLDTGPGYDLLDGGGGRDKLLGGSNTDVLVDGDRSGADVDSDVLDGGAGEGDLLAYTDRTRPVRVDLLESRAGEKGEDDAISGFEAAAGGRAGDRIAGTSGDNQLYGNGGADLILARGDLADAEHGRGDSLFGGRGRDRLAGGDGTDSLGGGPGVDSLSCGPSGEAPNLDRVSDPGFRDRVAPSCEVVSFSERFPDGDDYSANFPAYPVARSRQVLKFQFQCASQDVSEVACDTPIVLREASGRHRLLGRGRLAADRINDEPAPRPLERVKLTRLGRRLTSRAGGVAATLSMPSYAPSAIGWTIRLSPSG